MVPDFCSRKAGTRARVRESGPKTFVWKFSFRAASLGWAEDDGVCAEEEQGVGSSERSGIRLQSSVSASMLLGCSLRAARRSGLASHDQG